MLGGMQEKIHTFAGSGFKVQRFRVQRFIGSKVQGSVQPLAAGAASLIEKKTYEH
jgi:hypothetical protein